MRFRFVIYSLPAPLLVLLLGPQSRLVSAQTSSEYTSDSTFQSALLTAHNFFRDEHNASALTWNVTSAKYASDWTQGCSFQHSVCLYPLHLFSALVPFSLLFASADPFHPPSDKTAGRVEDLIRKSTNILNRTHLLINGLINSPHRTPLQVRTSRQATPTPLRQSTHGRMRGRRMISRKASLVPRRGISRN
jgi:hypothetical protein